jgi:hypothetical protein
VLSLADTHLDTGPSPSLRGVYKCRSVIKRDWRDLWMQRSPKCCSAATSGLEENLAAAGRAIRTEEIAAGQRTSEGPSSAMAQGVNSMMSSTEYSPPIASSLAVNFGSRVSCSRHCLLHRCMGDRSLHPAATGTARLDPSRTVHSHCRNAAAALSNCSSDSTFLAPLSVVTNWQWRVKMALSVRLQPAGDKTAEKLS